MTDDEAIRRLLAGETDAFGELIARYEGLVIAVCRDVLGDEHEALDAAQDAFVRAYVSLPQLRDPARLAAWLRRIASSVSLNRLNKRRPRPDGNHLEQPDPTGDPARHAQARELADAVMHSIARLPETYRDPARMFYLEDVPQAHIAERLGLRAGTVRTRLHRARELLRDELREWSPVEIMSRSKERRGGLPVSLAGKETTTMALQYERTNRRLLRGDEEVVIRPMRRDDVPAVRRFDSELSAEEWNANISPDGSTTSPGGPWSDDAWLLDHFNKYEAAGNVTLIAEDAAGRVVGFADLWAADEPEPFGRSLDVQCIDYFRDFYLMGMETVLLAEAETVARAAGLPALDIGTNTSGGEYMSLRRFGLRVFYEYDNVRCRYGTPPDAPRPERRMLAPAAVDLGGLVRVFHFAPSDFTFYVDEERAWIAELRWPAHRAVLELYGPEDGNMALPVPANAPERAALWAEPAVLDSTEMMSDVLAECAALAGEAGAEEIRLPCPSDTELDESKVDVIDRAFAFAWMRKAL